MHALKPHPATLVPAVQRSDWTQTLEGAPAPPGPVPIAPSTCAPPPSGPANAPSCAFPARASTIFSTAFPPIGAHVKSPQSKMLWICCRNLMNPAPSSSERSYLCSRLMWKIGGLFCLASHQCIKRMTLSGDHAQEKANDSRSAPGVSVQPGDCAIRSRRRRALTIVAPTLMH